MYEGWKDLPIEVILKNKKEVCAKCKYFSVYTVSKDTDWYNSTCDYRDFHGHIRGCLPTECLEKGIFEPKTNKRKRKKHIRITPSWIEV